MTSLQLATHILATIRKAKTFETSRAAFVAAAAQSGPDGATIREISGRLGETSQGIAGQMTRMQEYGILEQIYGTSPQRFLPTEKGLAILIPLLPNHRPVKA